MPTVYANVHDKYVQNYNKTGVKKLLGVPRQMVGKRKVRIQMWA